MPLVVARSQNMFSGDVDEQRCMQGEEAEAGDFGKKISVHHMMPRHPVDVSFREPLTTFIGTTDRSVIDQAGFSEVGNLSRCAHTGTRKRWEQPQHGCPNCDTSLRKHQ